jgi:hypothetical protein
LIHSLHQLHIPSISLFILGRLLLLLLLLTLMMIVVLLMLMVRVSMVIMWM